MAESGRFLPGEILHRSIMTSPMLGLVQQGSWPASMGYSVAITQLERTLPAPSDSYSDGQSVYNPAYDTTTGWTAAGTGGFGSTTTNNCGPKEINLQQGSSKTLFNLQGLAINSQSFCATDLMVAFDGDQQFAFIKDNLSNNTNWNLAEKFTYDYGTLCANKYVINVNGPQGVTNGSGTSATLNDGSTLQNAGSLTGSSVTLPWLIDLTDRLNRDGAYMNSLATDDGAPVHGLICSQQLARNLMIQSDTRNDFRWNRERVPELLRPLNVTQPPICGLQLLKTSIAPRWNYTGGQWVKVEPWIFKTANINGYKLEANPLYETATHEDLFIFHPDVLKVVFPGAVENTNGTTFNSVNYRGEWGFRNFQTATNQDGDVGYFRGRFMLGSIPRYTTFGAMVRFCRPVLSPTYAACPYPA